MSPMDLPTPGNGAERDKSLWLVRKEANPDHSQWYINRFKDMEAEGKDIAGEVRLIDAMASRGAKILDAGSGPGRIGKRLHALGHRVTGEGVILIHLFRG